MKKPTIIFLNRFFYPDGSATSQILSDLCFYLAGKDMDVRVVTSSQANGNQIPRGQMDLINKVRVSRVRGSGLGSGGSMVGRMIDYFTFYVSASVELARICRRGDLVVVKTDPPLMSIPAYLVAKLKGAKLLNWLQDLYPEVAIQLRVRFLRGPVGWLLTALRNIALRAADANVVIGSRMANRLRSAGVRSDAIHLVPNWSNDEAILPMDPSQSAVRKEWGIADDLFVLGYSGNFGRAHESETILGAAQQLKERKDILFLFVGSGHEGQKLRKSVAQLGFQNFMFKEHQSLEQLSDSLAAADAHWLSLRPELEGLIVPSKFYGIAAAGRPVIAVTAADGEVAEAVRAFGCGYVVEPGDETALAEAITEMARNQELRADMGRRARLAIDERYSRALALTRWETILGQLQ